MGSRKAACAHRGWRGARWWMVLAVLVASLGGLPGLVPGALAAPIVVTNGDDSGPGSLRQAIAEAADGDTIAFAEGVTTVTLTTAQLVISGKKLAIDGGEGVTIRRSDAPGTPAFRILAVSGGATVTLTALTVTNGATLPLDFGGGITSSGSSLTLVRCIISGNTAEGDGGGIANGPSGAATLIVTDSTVSDNTAGDDGGGIAHFAGTVTLTDSDVSGNVAEDLGDGGGIAITSAATLVMTRTTVSGNTAGGGGGGIFNASGAVTLTDSALSENASGGAGGGLASAPPPGSGTLALTRTVVSRNTAAGNGGGIYNGRSAATLTDSSLTGNSGNAGGGLYNAEATATLTNTVISDNMATDRGGGIANSLTLGLATLTVSGGVIGDNTAVFAGGGVANGGTATLDNTTVSGNTSLNDPGGGIYNAVNVGNVATMTLTDCTVSGNTAGRYGGGVANQVSFTTSTGTATLTLLRCTVSGNTSEASGGGVANSAFGSQATLAVTDSTISENSAGAHGGGIANDASGSTATATLKNSTVSGNIAGIQGGGLYAWGGGQGATSTLTIDYVTLADNTADADDNGSGEGHHLYTDAFGTGPVVSATIGHSVATHADAAIGGYFARWFTTTQTSMGYNVSRKGLPAPAATGDLVNTNPLLGPLAENGGPTGTHLPLPGSPVIDRIPAAACGEVATDQRGVDRPVGIGCDSGAVERTPADPAPAQVALTLAVVGEGSIGRDPLGVGSGPFAYPVGAEVELIPQAVAGWTFVGWMVDGVYRGWADPLTITMDADHTVEATFVETVVFSDVTGGNALVPITELASRGTIRGYGGGNYGPGDGVQRAQMAALIARAMPNGPGTPPTMLTPPSCLVGGTWDCEDWGNTFTDQGGIDPNLWRNAGALQHYQVAFGYGAADCERKGRAFPCYGPNDPVSHAQTIAFITRAMIAKGYWVAQPGAMLPYQGVPGVLAMEVRTFHYYTGGVPGLPANEGWNDGADRGWFARALWAALDSYWGMDVPLPDGRAAGGRVP